MTKNTTSVEMTAKNIQSNPGMLDGLMNEIGSLSSESSTLQNLNENPKTRLSNIEGSQEHSNNFNFTQAASNSTFPREHSQDDKILHTDTIILVASCAIMIILGLFMRKAFLYFAKDRDSRNEQLKQMIDHVHVVATKSLSYGIEESNSQPEENTNDRNCVTAVEVFRPTTHALTKEESDVGEYMTQLDVRRLSKMHNFLVNHE